MNGQRTCVPTVGTGYILPEKPSFVCSYFIDTCVAMCACTHTLYTVHVYRVLIVAIITRRYIYHQRLSFIFSRCLKGTWYNMCVQICFHFSHFRNRVT